GRGDEDCLFGHGAHPRSWAPSGPSPGFAPQPRTGGWSRLVVACLREWWFRDSGGGHVDDYLWVLKKDELDLVRELEPARIEKLDEDELIDLHRRVRRARNKHVKNYRRKAARDVEDVASRGDAAPRGGKARWRAAAFEEA